MRDVVYSVAMSLDGYIAGPEGEYGWIPEEPAMDWAAFMSRFDTVVMGRRTYEVVAGELATGPFAEMERVVFSRTLDPAEHPEVHVTDDDPAAVVERLRGRRGRDIWLMGGGLLFRSLLEEGMVDRVEVAVVPVLLGKGIPMLPPREDRAALALREERELPTGIVLLEYDVVREGGAA